MVRITKSSHTICIMKTRTETGRTLPHSEGSRTCHLPITASETMEDP